MKPLKGIKGNVIIPLGIMAIFIAAFFIIFVFDLLIYSNMNCLVQGDGLCAKDMFTNLTVGLFIIFFLIIMIAVAVYVMFMSLDMERNYRKDVKEMKAGDNMKGIGIIALLGVMVFFIASFSFLFVFDKFLSRELICILQPGAECADIMSDTFVSGIFMIIVLLVMIISAAYVMVKKSSADISYGR